MDLVEVFRFQARACQELGSPMYAALRDRMADDLAEGGAVLGTVLAGREDDPGPSALALRLVGGIHRQVLSGAAPELAAYFPSVGGVWHLDEAWPHIAALLRMRHDVLAPLLEHPPQTNEVGLRTARSFSTPRLARGGSSGRPRPHRRTGGLRHRTDRRLLGGGSAHPLVVCLARPGAAAGPAAWGLRGRPRLPADLRRCDAVSMLRGIDVAAGTATVVWPSVTWQCLTPEDKSTASDRIDEIGAAANEDTPLAHVSLEPQRRTPDSDREFLVTLRLWPGGRREVLGSAAPHGVPSTWEG